MIRIFKNNKHIFHYILILFFLIVNGVIAQADWYNLYNAYLNGQFKQLEKALENTSPQQQKSLEYLFFKSLFEKDGSKAVQNYQRIFDSAGGWLKSATAKKLYDYYYARGFYVKAKTYYQYINLTSDEAYVKALSEPSPVIQKDVYWVQFGAFSTKANAQKRQEMLKKNGIPSLIKIRRINNRNYYCVWVKGRSTLADTEQIARQIKKQLSFDYRIIKE